MDLKNSEMIIKKIYNWVTGDDANRFTGQKTSDKSISVVFSSDGGGVNIGDVELVDSNGDPLISQKTMDESLPVTIASNQSTLPVAGAVTNTVLTDIYDAVNHFIKVNIQNASLTVTGSLTGVTTVGTVTNDVGVKGLKALGDGVDTSIANTSTEITVPAGAEVVNICNKSATADMYPGITTSQRATGIKIRPGNTLLNYPVTGLSSFFLHSTVASETAGTQFFGRS